MIPTRTLRVVLAVGLVLAGLTAQRFALWHRGDGALWADAAHASASPRPWINLGNDDHLNGDDEAATVAYLMAERLADAHRSADEWMAGGALARANRALLYINDPACATMDYASPRTRTEARCNLGHSLIALAQDRWPENRTIHQLFLAVVR